MEKFSARDLGNRACPHSDMNTSKFLRNSQEIKGIDIEPGKTAKLAQYADDTTVIVKDDESVISLFELLSQFEKCSGLRINESKSELLWLGSSRFRKDKPCEKST